jgi:hypothetical protein
VQVIFDTLKDVTYVTGLRKYSTFHTTNYIRGKYE